MPLNRIDDKSLLVSQSDLSEEIKSIRDTYNLKLFNTLSREKEDFVPNNENEVKMYSCGPTVYDYAHIGNLRSYIFPDILKRVLRFIGYKNIKHVINFTDVGHLTSDADEGDDKVELASKILGKNAWDISRHFSDAFKEDIASLNIGFPSIFTPATEYIEEQINIIKELENRGFTYETEDGIYFDTSKFPAYGDMARLDIGGLQEGKRVDMGGKKNSTDFALWKFSPKDKKRQMEWDSPWGIGFPGWHIECSSMALSELGENIDIHTGGVDHINVHHTNEIAQSECSTGKKFVNYWLHGEFLQSGEDGKMSKSAGKYFTLNNLKEMGFLPMAYRYYLLTSHYRNKMNFSLSALKSAQKAYKKIISKVEGYTYNNTDDINDEELKKNLDEIISYLLDDLNTPKVISKMWEIIKNGKLIKLLKID